MKELWTSMASIMGVMAFCQTLLATFFPPHLRFSLLKLIHHLTNHFSSYFYFDITEIDGVNTNELYNAVQLYLSSATSTAATRRRFSLSRSINSSAVTFGLSHSDTLYDTFEGLTLRWEHIVVQRPPQSFSWRPVPDEKRGFTLRVRNANARGKVGNDTLPRAFLDRYLNHIVVQATEIRRCSQDRYLYTNSRGGCGSGLDPSRPGSPWEAVPFKHPSTFATLAMNSAQKAELMVDLKDFAEGESFYRATGRAWKRGYLLHGPPGTGKSSMIAAMANYLRYDVYDLELTEVGSNSELRRLLMKTTPKSIIVIEDIDCSLNLRGKRKISQVGLRSGSGLGPGHEDGSGSGTTVTLSGLLGFTDGLWSCCGSERIFVLTTNHVERIDGALLRRGRMDVHIHMGYCTYEGLKVLLRNYLGLGVDEMGEDLRVGFVGVVDKAKMTPADVSEVLIRRRKRAEKVVAAAEVLEEMRRRAATQGQEVEEEEKRELELEMVNGGGVGIEFDDDNEDGKEVELGNK